MSNLHKYGAKLQKKHEITEKKIKKPITPYSTKSKLHNKTNTPQSKTEQVVPINKFVINKYRKRYNKVA